MIAVCRVCGVESPELPSAEAAEAWRVGLICFDWRLFIAEHGREAYEAALAEDLRGLEAGEKVFS